MQLAVPGVAHCNTFGGEVRQLQIQVRPDRLAAFGLSVGDVVAAARRGLGGRIAPQILKAQIDGARQRLADLPQRQRNAVV